MTDTPEPTPTPEPATSASDDLDKLVAGLTAPLAGFAQTISAGLVSVIRAMLNAAYARGQADGIRQATLVAAGAKPTTVLRSTGGTIPSGLGVVHNDRDRSEPVITAQELRKIQRRYDDGGEAGVCA